MRLRLVAGVSLLLLSGCEGYPRLVMLNPRTGATVDCQKPDLSAAPTEFLLSRACLSACEARGFVAVPNLPASPAIPDIPAVCLE